MEGSTADAAAGTAAQAEATAPTAGVATSLPQAAAPESRSEAVGPEKAQEETQTTNCSGEGEAEDATPSASASAAAVPGGAIPGEAYYSRLVMVDWGSYKPQTANSSGEGPGSEILEFCWAVYDVDQRRIVDQSQHRVRPVETRPQDVPASVLETFHTTVEELEGSKTLAEILVLFDAAASHVPSPSVSVVYGSVKLRDELLTETYRKRLALPRSLKAVIDLCTIATHFYRQLAPDVVSPMEAEQKATPKYVADKLLDYHFTGAEFGMNCCMVMAGIVSRMIQDKIDLKPEHISTVRTDVDSNSVSGGLKQESAVKTESPSSKPVIRLRGIPWDVTTDQIVEFLATAVKISKDDVYIVTGPDGRAVGEAFVVVPDDEARSKCIKLHGAHLGRRWIEVFRASEEDLKRRNLGTDGRITSGGALRLRGLPWSTNEFEVVQFFKDGGFEVEASDVVLGTSNNNRLTGECWIHFENAAKVDEARRELNRKMIGRRYIELFPCTLREFEMAKRGQLPTSRHGYYSAGPYGRGYGSNWGDQGYSASSYDRIADDRVLDRISARERGFKFGSRVVRMRGLPYHANEHHIVEFFAGFAMSAILPATVPIDGRPSGEAYVEFVSEEVAWNAIKARNGSMMDRRYIELFPAHEQEMAFAARGFDPRELRARDRRDRF